MYFKSNVYLNEFANNFKTYTSYPDITDVWTNIHIKSVDRFILKSYIHHFCQNTLKMCMDKNVFVIKENTYHIYKDIVKIDISSINNHNAFIEYLKELVSKKPMFGDHKLFILENIECTYHTKSIFSLIASSIDKNHAYFIVTGQNEIKNDFLQSRMITIRLPAITQLELKKFCELNHIDASVKQQQKIQSNTESICQVLLNMNVNSNKPIANDVDVEFKSILKTIHKQKSLGHYLQLVRDTIYKLQTYNVKHTHICKRLLHVICKMYAKNESVIHFSINLVADLQHKLQSEVSKPLCHYEYFFLLFYERVVIS